jgi:twitching motility protein PilU
LEFSSLLEKMVVSGASDLFLSVNAPAYFKIEGKTKAFSHERLSSTQVHNLVYSILNDNQTRIFESTSELNMALRIANLGRFRVNVFRQMGEIALVARHIKAEIPSIKALGLPSLLEGLILEQRGLILLVGGTGTGKSTTLASMIDYRNSNNSGHILTIEDPVEFVHEHKKSLVNQREVGLDTESYEVALKNAMREAPDVIMIGEIRDMETMKSALSYAETGHLCVSTLHANNANQAIDRILNFFPEEAHKQALQDLSLNLRAVVSQRLPKGTHGKRVAAIEVMLNTPYISNLIAKGDIVKIKEAMLQARELGCKTFDDALFDLVQEGKIAEDEALLNADSKTNLTLRFKLEGRHAESSIMIKKDVAYAKFVDFEQFTNYRIKRVNVDKDITDRADLWEDAIRHVMFQKGLREENEAPDLEIQYVFNAKNIKEKMLGDIEEAVASQIDIRQECKKHGVLKINIVNLYNNKAVWQVTASRELAVDPRPQSQMNREAEYLFDEFPPE